MLELATTRPADKEVCPEFSYQFRASCSSVVQRRISTRVVGALEVLEYVVVAVEMRVNAMPLEERVEFLLQAKV